MFAPRTPKLARHITGKEIPYLVPACALRTIGMSMMTCPSKSVISACHQVIPSCISPDASVYVVMTTLIPIQSAAMLYVDQVRRESGVGARSLFQRGLDWMSSGTDTASGA